MSDRRRRIFRAAFDFLTEHAPASRHSAYWEETTAHVCALAASLDNDPLALDLLTAVMLELERQEDT